MRVKVTHGIDVDKVPEKIKLMLIEITTEFNQIANKIKAAQNLSTGVEYLDTIAKILDNSRKTLTELDQLMTDCHSITSGLAEFLMTPDESVPPVPQSAPPPVVDPVDEKIEATDVREG